MNYFTSIFWGREPKQKTSEDLVINTKYEDNDNDWICINILNDKDENIIVNKDNSISNVLSTPNTPILYNVLNPLIYLLNGHIITFAWISYRILVMHDVKSVPYYIFQVITPSYARPLIFAYENIPPTCIEYIKKYYQLI